MAIRVARRFRLPWILPLVIVLLLLAGVIAQAPATAQPGGRDNPTRRAGQQVPRTIAGMQQRLGRLALRNTELVERFNQARVLVQHRQRQADVAEHAAERARTHLHRASASFAAMVQAQYEAGQLGAAGALLDSHSGGNALARLNTLDLMSRQAAAVVARVDAARRTAAEKNRAAQRALSEATHGQEMVGERRGFVASEIDRYKRLLGMLSATQRAEYVHSTDPAVSFAQVRRLPSGSSAAARKAVNFALRQVGKPYVFGAAGPSSYDCSGLTMAAWASAGVHLPHSAADQFNYGRHVPESELKPGDLLFFYQPIDHVTIYVGDGLMVSAPTEGENVQVVQLSTYQSDYVGATRLG